MKSQISTEFIFAIGITFFIFLILTGINFEKKAELRYTEKIVDLKAECLRISNIINSMYAVGEGANITTRLRYNSTVYGDSRVIAVNIGDVDVSCSFPLNMVSNGSDTNFNLIAGNVNFINIDSIVVMRNI